jgi:uncharacterized damage-inducible protein DinB
VNHNDRNRAARERLNAVIDRLGDRAIPMEGGWTASALLAHLAFWDRLATVRLEKYLRDGEPPVTAVPALTDLTNGAAMRQWKDTPPAVAASQARDAAAAMDRLVESVPAGKLAALMALDRPLLYDRSGHRTEHLDQIERALE